MIQKLVPVYGYSPGDIQIETIGVKPGEKMYEELMSLEEIRRAVELPRYFAVLPAFRGIYRNIDYNYSEVVSDEVTNPYISANEPLLSQDELQSFLGDNDLLTIKDQKSEHPDRRYWPGD